MGWLDKVNRVWSGLDFWQKDENRQQREDFAAQDREEERRRRQREAAARQIVNQSTGFNDEEPTFDFTKKLVKAASQSDVVGEPQGVAGSQSDTAKLKKAVPLSVARVGTGMVQGLSGLYDLASPGKGTNRLTKATNSLAEKLDKTAKDQGVEDVYKAGNVVGEVGSYFTPGVIGKVAGKIPTVAKWVGKLGKASNAVGEIAPETGRVQKFLRKGAEDLIDPKNLQQEARLTGRYTGQDSAQEEEVTPGSIALNAATAVPGSFILSPLLKAAGKKLGSIFKRGEDAPNIPGVSRGAGPEEAIEVEAGIKSTNLVKVRDENILDTRPQPVPPPRQIDEATYLQEKEALSKQYEDGYKQAEQMGPLRRDQFLVDLEASTDQQLKALDDALGAGTVPPRPVVNDVRIPDVTNPIALAKADPMAPVMPTAVGPIADFQQAIDVPLQKVELSAPPPIATTADLRLMTPEGNPGVVSDVVAAQRALDEGIVPARGDSPVAALEDEMAAAAELAAREQVVPGNRLGEVAGTGEMGRSTGKYARGQEYEKTSIEAAQARGREGASQMSYEQLMAEVGENGATGRHIDVAREMQNRFPTGSAEHRELGQLINRQGTLAGQQLRLQDQVVRRTAAPKQLTDRFANKLYAKMGDEGVLTEADFNQLGRLNEDFVATRNGRDAAYDAFLNDPSDVNTQAVVNSIRAAEEADKAAKLGEFQIAQTKLGGQRQGDDVQRFLTQLEKDAGVYKMSYVDSSMLSSTRVMLNNFLNTMGVGKEEQLFGKAGARLARLLTGEEIGGGSRAGRKLGQKIGNQNVATDYRLRKQGTGNTLVKAIQNFTTTGNTLGERNIQGAVYSGIYDHYRQVLKKAGFKGDELKRRTLVNSLMDPDGVKEAYTAPILTANALSSLTGAGGKKVETMMKDALTRKLGGSKPAEAISNAVMRITLGFPTVIARSFEQGVRRLSLGSVSTAQAVKSAITGGDRAVTAQHIKNAVKEAGSGATMIALGSSLAQANMIAGSYPSDPDERAAWQREGKTENSIRIGDHWYSLPAMLGGFALPFMMGANITQMEEGDNPAMTAFSTAVDSLPVESFANMPNMILNIQKGRDVSSEIAQAGVGLVRGLTPLGSLVNQVTKAFDETANDTTKGDALAQFLAKVRDGLPGLNQGLPDKVVDGVPVENPDTIPRMLGAASKVQGGGEEQTAKIQGKIDENVSRLNEYGVFTDNVSKMLDDESKVLFNKAREGGQLDDSEREGLMKALTKGVGKEGETRFLEDEDYDSHLAVLKTKRDLLESDPTTRKSDLEEYDKQIKRAEIYKEKDYDYELIKDYKETGLEDWRKLGDPEDEDYSEDTQALYEALWDIDEAMADAGVGRGKKEKAKFYAKKAGKGRGGSGRSARARGFTTSIGMQSFKGGGFDPLKPLKADFARPESAIPVITPVPNYDRSKLKKISVSKGVK